MFEECGKKACQDQAGVSQCWENTHEQVWVQFSARCQQPSKEVSSSARVLQHGESKVVLCCGWTATNHCYREFVCADPALCWEILLAPLGSSNVQQNVTSKHRTGHRQQKNTRGFGKAHIVQLNKRKLNCISLSKRLLFHFQNPQICMD